MKMHNVDGERQNEINLNFFNQFFIQVFIWNLLFFILSFMGSN